MRTPKSKKPTKNEIRAAEIDRDRKRANLADALQIKAAALRLRAKHGDMLSAALLDALGIAEETADYDLEISAYEYRNAVLATRDVYADA